MTQGWLSRLARGRTRFVTPHAYQRGALALDGCLNGLLFADGVGNTFVEWYDGHREKLFELLYRNPLLELARTLDKRYMDSLFATLLAFSRHPERATFVAAVTFGYSPAQGDLRVREVAKSPAGQGAGDAIKRLMNVEILVVARALGARRLVAETYPAYGKHLVQQGWIEDSSGRPWSIRVGAALNRDRCYARLLSREGEEVRGDVEH